MEMSNRFATMGIGKKNGITPAISTDEKDRAGKLILMASKNIVDFRRLMLENGSGELKPAHFHYEWSDILLTGVKNFAIEAYRESGKSNIVLRAFPLYCLTFPRYELSYIALVMANKTLAEKKIKEITREFFDNKLL